MNINQFHVLLIDDDEDDYVHITDLLGDIRSSSYTLTWKSDYSAGLKALREGTFDACLLDYRLGEKTGIDLLVETHPKGVSCPVIFLTGLTDFEIDVQAMQMGASDYLVKDQLTSPLLERSIRYSIKHRHDLEEIKEGKAQIIQQDRLASLGLLASSLAHEIGTPLGIIRSRAEMAERKVSQDPNLKRDMGIIVTQIDRIAKLVNSLLNLAREKKSDMGLAVQINSVLEDVLGLLHHELIRKDISFQKDLEGDFRIKAESGPMGQVLLNLLVNAIHAIEESRTAHPEKPRSIHVSTREKGHRIEIAVTDTGAGISDENLQQIFKPFFTTKGVGQGTGLGLATSLGIVKSWGGELLVSSQVGIGSTFRVLLDKF